ncbi:MAG: hypothetical protein H6815_04490 [Phycisphaeraceae bacterium]|nr:hypothetical protein [Phycisphaerales bacterium]MCB9859691.1 hypothetical protein [Phycisphaeraceae bacterium]
MRYQTAVCLAFAMAAGTASAQTYLGVLDRTSDVLMLLDPATGAVVDPAYIVGTGIWSTPVEALRVGDEIWITEQLDDFIYRYDLNGNALGQFTSVLDNCRGFAVVNNTVYVSNSGSNNGAPGNGDGIAMFDFSGNYLGFFAVDDPFDVLDYNGNLLIPDIINDDLLVYDYAGNFVSVFHDSDGVNGIDFPEQLNIRFSNGGILAGGFSSPSGMYAYDANGAQTDYWTQVTGVRGMWELPNGRILATGSAGGSGLFLFDPATGAVQTLALNTMGFISELDLTPTQTCYADCDQSGSLNIFDYICFGNEYSAGTSYADCDGSGSLNIFDYICFGNAYAAGCP